MRISRKVLIPVLFLAVIGASVAACDTSTSQSAQQEQAATNSQMDQYLKVQPIPYFDSSAMRQTLIEILKAQVTPTNTWSVEVALDGTALFMCPSIGYPIPATDELTNPQQVVNVNTGKVNGANQWESGVVSQADPNGVYGGDTAGTYILCVAPDGKYTPVYAEPNVTVFPFPVTIDPVTHRIVVDPNGASTISVDLNGKGKQVPTPTPTK
jgi:hypothetical protein